jgi:hypothetical protein
VVDCSGAGRAAAFEGRVRREGRVFGREWIAEANEGACIVLFLIFCIVGRSRVEVGCRPAATFQITVIFIHFLAPHRS